MLTEDSQERKQLPRVSGVFEFGTLLTHVVEATRQKQQPESMSGNTCRVALCADSASTSTPDSHRNRVRAGVLSLSIAEFNGHRMYVLLCFSFICREIHVSYHTYNCCFCLANRVSSHLYTDFSALTIVANIIPILSPPLRLHLQVTQRAGTSR